MDSKTLSGLLMKKKRLQVINTLLENGERDFTITELSEKSEVGYKTVHGLVGELAKFGIVKLNDRGGNKLVSLNSNSPYLDILRELGTIDSQPLLETAKDFAEEVKQEHSEVNTVALFGSVLNGLPTQESDIDILVLLDSEVDEIERLEEEIWDMRDRYEREENVNLSPVIMKRKRFESNAKNRNPFEKRVQETGKVLEGESLK